MFKYTLTNTSFSVKYLSMFEVLLIQADGNILSTVMVVEFANVIPDDAFYTEVFNIADYTYDNMRGWLKEDYESYIINFCKNIIYFFQ